MDDKNSDLNWCPRCGKFSLMDEIKICQNCDIQIIGEIKKFINKNEGMWAHTEFDNLVKSMQCYRPDWENEYIHRAIDFYYMEWHNDERNRDKYKTKEDYIDELKQIRKNIGESIHKLGHCLTLLVGYIDLTTLGITEENETKEKLIEYLDEAKEQYSEVDKIIRNLAIFSKAGQ